MPRQTLSNLKAAVAAGQYADDLYSETRRRLEFGRWLITTRRVSDQDVVFTDAQEAAIDRLIQRNCPGFWPRSWFDRPLLLSPELHPTMYGNVFIRPTFSPHIIDTSG